MKKIIYLLCGICLWASCRPKYDTTQCKKYFNCTVDSVREGLYKIRTPDAFLGEVYDVEEYYINGQAIITISSYKGKIYSIRGFLPPNENGVSESTFENYYKNGKLIVSCQKNLDSINRHYDINSINNGELSIDSLNYLINKELTRRDTLGPL